MQPVQQLVTVVSHPALAAQLLSTDCTGHLCLLQGLDISESMLDVAREREVEGDLCLHDLGHGLPLRPGTFDGAISISAVQWLCNAVSEHLLHATHQTACNAAWAAAYKTFVSTDAL